MTALALGLIGIVIGAVGSEVLRAVKPELVEKVEDKARQLADGIALYKPDEENPDDFE